MGEVIATIIIAGIFSAITASLINEAIVMLKGYEE